MNKIFCITLILFSILTVGCSKTPGKTAAKVKLNLSGIVGFSASGAGEGGAILFGRNNTNGHIFGKAIAASTDAMELSNGDWVFYAFVWNKPASDMMNGRVQCAKVAQSLKGTETTISMSLNNANCADPEFSEGRNYFDSTNIKFADVYLEECDETATSLSYGCGYNNTGSGLSYRVKFQSFMKGPNTGFLFLGTPIVSSCVTSAYLSNNGLPINFPSGGLNTPFVLTIETFLSKNDCDLSGVDEKGVHQVVLNQGLRSQNPVGHKVLFSNSIGSPNTGDFTGSVDYIKEKCLNMMGTLTGAACTTSSIPMVIKRFAPAAEIATQTASTPAIKHMLSIPLSLLCDKYENISSGSTPHPFAGGNGTSLRPYKICNEWQLNQIGELGSSGYNSSHFKLMRNLDMNKTDFGPYAKPSCVGVSSSIVKEHHNLNPLDGLYSSCVAGATPTGFAGRFNGNNKTISFARISAESVNEIGFVRKLIAQGEIVNLNFKNFEVRGDSYVGAVAGSIVSSSGARIQNVKIDVLDVESSRDGAAIAGGVTSEISSGSPKNVISNVHLKNADISGAGILGGFAGNNQGDIIESSFNGYISSYVNGGSFVGGIVAQNGGQGVVSKTYSEGYIESWQPTTGGIVGFNFGNVNDVYSTMVIKSKGSMSNTKTAGIIADNDGTAYFRDVYFDGLVSYTGGGTTPNVHGVFNGVEPSSPTPGLCFFTTAHASSTFCISKTHAQLRSGSLTYDNTVWKADTASIRPRLKWEFDKQTRPCFLSSNLATVALQATAGRGGVLNPIIICTENQLVETNSRPGSEFYNLEEDLNLSTWTSSTILNTFAGNLNGKDHVLYGLNINEVSNITGGVAIVKLNNGTIRNLAVNGNTITYSSTTTPSAILAARNFGTINNVWFSGNKLSGYSQSGIATGVNQGTINKVEIDDAELSGRSSIGGVAGESASGNILRSTFSGIIKDQAANPDYFSFGGIVGFNDTSSTIDQVEFSGTMEFSTASTYSSGFPGIGGIVGLNNGVISNALVRNYGYLGVRNMNLIGGLVGDNTGTITTSINLGKVIYNGGGAIAGGSFFGPLYGRSSGGSLSYLKNLDRVTAAYIGTSTASGVCSFTTPMPFYLTLATPEADLMTLAYGNNSSLTSFDPFTITSNYTITTTALCNVNDTFNFYKGFAPGGLNPLDFGDSINFGGFDLAVTNYSSPGLSTEQERLYEYYKSLMYERLPTLTPPIWELEEGESHPRLLQLDH